MQNSPTYSPLVLPQPKHCLACSLTCQIKFDYMRVNGWQMSIVRVVDRTFKTDVEGRSILRFYVNNFNATPFHDITYNGTHYQLEFIEFYLPAVHRVSIDSEESSDNGPASSGSSHQHQLEMVLCHRVVDTEADSTKWLNVSVFALAQPSYSLTNTFFYQLINTVLVSPATDSAANIYNSKHLDTATSTSVMPNINWDSPVLNHGQQRAVKRDSSSNDATDSPAIKIDVGRNWTPYDALPADKGFYSYRGEFVYAPCKFHANDEVMWVIMQQPVSIHGSEYDVLKAVIGSSTERYAYNNGNNYVARPLGHGRDIMFNNGELVVGNRDQDKFIIKCAKAEDRPRPSRAMGEARPPQDKVSAESKSGVYTTYRPPISPMSAIMFSVLFSVFLFAIFASSNWVHQTIGDVAEKTQHVQYGMVVMISIALFVLYGLSFALASAFVGLQPLFIFVMAMVLMLWNAFPMKFLVRKSSELYASGSSKWKVFSWVLYACAMTGWVIIMIHGFVAAFNALAFLNGSVTPAYKYYFTVSGPGGKDTLYIGKTAAMQMNFAGYRLNYISRGTKVFDDNYIALPQDFMNLYGLLEVTKKEGMASIFSESKVLEELDVQKQVVLEEYDALMKRDHTKPLDALIQAVRNTLDRADDSDDSDSESDDEEETAGESAGGAKDKTSSEPSKSVTITDETGVKHTVAYRLTNIDELKTNIRTKTPDFYKFMLKRPIH